MKKKREEQMDRISDLPDPIVHQIMSFLTTLDFTKISILSKRFFFLWSSFPVVDFDETAFSRTYQGTLASLADAFLDHIQNSIRLRRIDTVISEFRVKANLPAIYSDRRLDSAISFALDNGVKLLDLNLGVSRYQLPFAFASKSINVLRLKGFKLDLCKLIKACPSLETLSLNSCVILRDIKFSSQTLEKLELHCCAVKIIKIKAPNLHSFFYDSGTKDLKPCWIDVLQCENIAHLSLNNVVTAQDWIEEHVSTLGKLETFVLNGCQDIQSIRVLNNRLERVEIGNCPALASIKVIAPSLESFQYKGTDRNRFCDINFITSKCIKDLAIESAGITDEWLETQLTATCCLESLCLKACNFLKEIRVFHEKLQILKLLDCLHLVEVEVDTPELVSFIYNGNIVEFGKMVTRSSCTATLSIKPWMAYNNEAFYRWRKLLSFFGHCKALKLFCTTAKELIIPENLREKLLPPLYDLQCLEVHIKSLERIETTDLMDSLLWLSPLPNTLTISSSSSRSLQQIIIKFTYDETIKEEEDRNPFCCTGKPVKCWRHNLTRLEIQTNHSVSLSRKHGSVELQKYFFTNAFRLDSLSFT